MKLIDFIGLGKAGELRPVGWRFGNTYQQVLVFTIEIKDLHELVVRSIDKFLAATEGRKLLRLKFLQMGKRLLEHGEHLLLASEQFFARHSSVFFQPRVLLDQQLMSVAANFKMPPENFFRFHGQVGAKRANNCLLIAGALEKVFISVSSKAHENDSLLGHIDDKLDVFRSDLLGGSFFQLQIDILGCPDITQPLVA
jgi:hypothetical protein